MKINVYVNKMIGRNEKRENLYAELKPEAPVYTGIR
jgi:hypothetical protein